MGKMRSKQFLEHLEVSFENEVRKKFAQRSKISRAAYVKNNALKLLFW